MVPTGDYARLRSDIINRYDTDIPITFGILVADYRQSDAREYILIYLDNFSKKSDRYIDFFIPGYTAFGGGAPTKIYDENKNQLYFNSELFDDFIENFEKDFNFQYECNPVLILVGLDNSNLKKSKKIVVNLQNQEGGVRNSGKLFLQIFDIAKRYVDIDDFSYELRKTYIKGINIDVIINLLGNNFIKQLKRVHDISNTYKIT